MQIVLITVHVVPFPVSNQTSLLPWVRFLSQSGAVEQYLGKRERINTGVFPQLFYPADTRVTSRYNYFGTNKLFSIRTSFSTASLLLSVTSKDQQRPASTSSLLKKHIARVDPLQQSST